MKKLLLFPALLMLTAGCNKGNTARLKHSECEFAFIDTLTIHGIDHEIIKYDRGIMHSPECWCGKEVGDNVLNKKTKNVKSNFSI